MLAARSTLTRGQIIEDALSHGRSLAWQEKWIAGVQAGIEAADRGDFANEEEVAAVLNNTVGHSGLCELSGPDAI